MGTIRNLPEAHPIYKLLYPHFRYTMEINVLARSLLISDGGILDKLFGIGGLGRVELMKRGYDAYRVHSTNIKRSAKERGVDDPKKLYPAITIVMMGLRSGMLFRSLPRRSCSISTKVIKM